MELCGDLIRAEASWMIEDLRRDHQFIRPCLFDESFQYTLYCIARSDRGAGQDLVQQGPLLGTDAIQITLHRRLQTLGVSAAQVYKLSLIHISEPTRLGMISYAVFCLKK